VPDCVAPTEPIAPNDAWCDDADRPEYNRMVRLPYDGHYEELWRQDGLYDLIGVLGWNDAPVQRGRGSAIFLHVARSDYASTDGCIALALPELRQLLARGLTEVLILGE
jgi:L,D-peptidoglycan transpeptidase YkuD (ErfK/YbiS/YcfS/YnhG family)